jgi:hypothetical protein
MSVTVIVMKYRYVRDKFIAGTLNPLREWGSFKTPLQRHIITNSCNLSLTEKNLNVRTVIYVDRDNLIN